MSISSYIYQNKATAILQNLLTSSDVWINWAVGTCAAIPIKSVAWTAFSGALFVAGIAIPILSLRVFAYTAEWGALTPRGNISRSPVYNIEKEHY